jgi:hypothetical protein
VAQRGAKRECGTKTHLRTKGLWRKRSHKMLPKFWYFNYKELGNFAKDYENVRHNYPHKGDLLQK